MRSQSGWNNIGLTVSMKFIFILTLVLFVGFAILIIGISLLPLESIKAAIESMVLGNITDLISENFYRRFTLSIRIAGIAMLLLTSILYFGRRDLAAFLSSLRKSTKIFTQHLLGHLVIWIKQEDRQHIFSILLTFLMSIAFRLHCLLQPIRNDEAWTYLAFASKPAIVGLSVYTSPNNHIFHTFLTHIATVLFGGEPWAIRFPAFLAGILMVPAGYSVIRMLFNKHAGLLAAILIACSPLLIDFSTNARGYTIICLIFLLLIGLGDHIRRNDELAPKAMFVGLASLGLFTVPIMIYPLGSVLLWLVLSALMNDIGIDKRSFLKSLFWIALATALLTLILHMPVMFVSGIDAILNNKTVSPQNWSTFLSSILPRLHWLWMEWNSGFPLFMQVFLAIGFLWALLRHKANANHNVPLVIAVIICCATIVLIQRVFAPQRVWLFLLPLYLGIASVGLVDLIKLTGNSLISTRVMPILLLAILITLGFGILTNKPSYYYENKQTLFDAEKMALYLHDELKENDIIVSVFPATKTLKFYFQKHGVSTKYFNVRRLANAETSPNRVFVVIKKPEQDLAYVFSKRNDQNNVSINVEDYVQLGVKEYDSAYIVSLRRKNM